MANLKHVGKMKANGRKVLVAYRTLPGESDSALVIQTENLLPEQHDALIKLVESPAGQNSYEFAEVMARTQFPDGSNMLANLHYHKRLSKVSTSSVEMTPSNQSSVSLDQLNQMIAEQRGISVNDLALGNSSATTIEDVATVNDISNTTTSDVVAESQAAKIDNEPLSDAELAKRFRSQADAMYKEAARLRAEAEKLAPIKKSKVAAEE
jgi:hypothetical protein